MKRKKRAKKYKVDVEAKLVPKKVVQKPSKSKFNPRPYSKQILSEYHLRQIKLKIKN